MSARTDLRGGESPGIRTELRFARPWRVEEAKRRRQPQSTEPRGQALQRRSSWLAAALRKLQVKPHALPVDEHDSVVDELLAGAIVRCIAPQGFQWKEELNR